MTRQLGPLTSASLLLRGRGEPGNQEVWTIFQDRYHPIIFSWCCSQGLENLLAWEVAQAILRLLVERMRTVEDDPDRRFRAWLRSTTRDVWCAYSRTRQSSVRKRGDTRILGLLQSEPVADDLAHLLEQEYDRELLDEATHRVRERVDELTWEAYRRTTEMGQSSADAAATLDTSVSAVFKGKSRVVKMLRDEINQLEDRT